MGVVNKFTQEEIDYIREYYPDTDTVVMAAHIGRSARSIMVKASRLGISKSPEHMSAVIDKFIHSENKHRFKPGQSQKWKTRYVRPGSNKSWYKEGYTPAHKLAIGTIARRQHKVRKSEYYTVIKISDFRWVRLPLYVWLKNGRPEPGSRQTVVQVSGDMDNPTIDDLLLVPKSIHMRMTVHGYTYEEAQCLDVIQQIKQEIRNEDADE